MKKTTTILCTFALILAITTTSAFASIAGSTLTATTGYLPGVTNTLVYRCDAVTPDYEYMYTVEVQYLTGMNVISGYKATGEVNGGIFSYNGAAGDAALARWDSDENLGTGYGSLINGESGYFTNEVIIDSSITSDVILTYYLFGDGYAGSAEPHALTNTLTLKEISTTGIDDARILKDSTITNYCCFKTAITACATIYIAGKTGSAGPASNLTVEIGYGTSGTSAENTDWEWEPVSYGGPSNDGSNDVYCIGVKSRTYVTTFDFAFRVSKDNGPFIYVDSDGTANGYDTNYNVKVVILSCPPVGSNIYEQTMSGSFNSALGSTSNDVGTMYFTADNFTLANNTFVKSVSWEGLYYSSYPRDGNEKGFNLLVFDNATAAGNMPWNHPGNIIYSNFFNGYACEEEKSNSGIGPLYRYKVDLPEQLLLQGNHTYWFCVQFMTSSSYWFVNETPAPVVSPVALQSSDPIMNGPGNWTTNNLMSDIGFAIYGESAPEPEINIQGNGIDITNGSLWASASNGTFFGVASLASGKAITNTFVVQNLGSTNLELSSLVFYYGDPDFYFVSSPSPNISPGSSSIIKIGFKPIGGGSITGLVALANNDNNESPYLFMIVGNSLAPEISVSPLSIDFGQIDIDTVTKTNIAIENIGEETLVVNAAITNCVPQSGLMSLNWDSANINTGDTDYLELNVDSTGFAENTYTCQVSFTSNDPDNPNVFVPASVEVIPEPFYLSFIIYCLIFINRKFIKNN